MLIFAIKYSQSSLMNTIEQKIGVIDVFIQWDYVSNAGANTIKNIAVIR